MFSLYELVPRIVRWDIQNDPLGICRTISQTLTTCINSLKADVDNLKQSTQSILFAVKSISTSLESSVG